MPHLLHFSQKTPSPSPASMADVFLSELEESDYYWHTTEVDQPSEPDASLGSMAGIERRVAHPLSSNRRHHYHHRGHQLCQIPLPAAGGQKAARAVEGVDQRGHHLGPWHRNNPPLSPLPLLRLYERLQQYKISPSRSRSKRRHCATKSKVLQPRQPKPPRWDMQPTGLTFGPPELLLPPPPPPPPPLVIAAILPSSLPSLFDGSTS